MALKKLIEVALPLDAINAASAREKSIRHGHPSTLHLWWARRPLAAARAVIWASLVDDPSSHPEKFPTEEEQRCERERLFRILEDLVVWENSNEPRVLEAARAEIKRSMGDEPIALLDPFAGGGAIPLEAQRLGLEAYAQDLNPVAVAINKAMIEIPPRFAGCAAVNPASQARKDMEDWSGANGLAQDVAYYGAWMKQEAYRRIGHLYPKVKVPREQGGGEATVIAWLWARTVKCPNPACGCTAPLVRSFDLSKKRGHEWHVEPQTHEGVLSFAVKRGKSPREGTVRRTGATCLHCGTPLDFAYIREEGRAGRMGAVLEAVVAEGARGRIYVAPSMEQEEISHIEKPETYPSGDLSGKCRVNVSLYGFDKTSDLFTARQLTALTTFSDLVSEAQKKAEADAINAGLKDDQIPLRDGGAGAKAYGEAVGVYLAFVINKLADRGSTICSWDSSRDGLRNTFGRQAIPMVWDYAEANPFCNSSGCFDNMLDWVFKCVKEFPRNGTVGHARQADAQSPSGLANVMVSTDPPYYDNIGYADLSDFFYVWLRRSLKSTYPDLFSTLLVPKAEELVATPYRFEGSAQAAKTFFETGMLAACRNLYACARDDVPLTLYYAYKQSDAGTEGEAASSGWETMLSAIIEAGFAITGTWPMRTEMANRSVATGTNALASSIVLVCRKRASDAPFATRREFTSALKRELTSALGKLTAANIAPVDLAQSAIGPGMGVFSRYSQVLEADGTPMSVRSALQVINRELDLYFAEADGELDAASRFCVELFTQCAFNEIKYGDADVLARAKNTSVEALRERGVLFAQKGVVRLLCRDELAEPRASDAAAERSFTWLFAQRLTHAMEQGGIEEAAGMLKDVLGADGEDARSLAYRLFTIADRRGWQNEAFAYNALVVAWPEIQSRAAALAAQAPVQTRFDI